MPGKPKHSGRKQGRPPNNLDLPHEDGFKVADDGTILRWGYFGWQPIAYYLARTPHERVQQALADGKRLPENLRPLERCAAIKSLLRSQER